jgi:hypothetical protein
MKKISCFNVLQEFITDRQEITLLRLLWCVCMCTILQCYKNDHSECNTVFKKHTYYDPCF